MRHSGPDKDLIRTELLKCAHARPMEILFYSDFAPRVKMSARGPWKKVLDEISREETEKGLPDITFLLKRKSTGYPGQIDFKKAETPDIQQKLRAREKLQEVIDKYNCGSLNPY